MRESHDINSLVWTITGQGWRMAKFNGQEIWISRGYGNKWKWVIDASKNNFEGWVGPFKSMREAKNDLITHLKVQA